MSFTRSRWALAASALLTVAACQSRPTTDYDYVKGADFGQYRTFSWVDDHPLRFHSSDFHASPLLEQHLMEAARAEFAGRGLRFVDDAEAADLLVAFTVGSRERIIVDGYYVPISNYDPHNGSYWFDTSQTLGSFSEGQVCIDLFDRSAARPVWHGTAREPVGSSDVEYWRDSVGRIMAAILAGYPPNSNGPTQH